MYTLFCDNHTRYSFGYAGSCREKSDTHYGIWYFECIACGKKQNLCV